MTLVAGIDSSTQSCKVVIRDAETGKLVRQGRAIHPEGTEVHPDAWWAALREAIDEAGAWSRKPGHVVWIGLLEPSRELLLRVQDQFGLHDLAMTDAATPHGYPKVEQYGDALFVVARTAQLVDRRVAFGETQFFLGKGHIISVRYGASTTYAAVRQHWESCPTVLAAGEDFILYAILDPRVRYT